MLTARSGLLGFARLAFEINQEQPRHHDGWFFFCYGKAASQHLLYHHIPSRHGD
jgi:hypothetical protein